MKKILFIDRDGTIILENHTTYQIDSIDKINFYPKIIFFLSKIVQELNYDLVMVSNQDGLGTDQFPDKIFWPIHNHILNILKTEGINFISVHIDKTFPEEKSINRKPEIGMLKNYLKSDYYNISESFVIGDRLTDVLLAKNLGCKSIWIKNSPHYKNLTQEEKNYLSNIDEKDLKKTISLKTDSWEKIYEYLSSITTKKFVHQRTTLETNVKITISLYGKGRTHIQTGLRFFDHLLQQIAFHGSIDLNIQTKGDLCIDDHHTIEDTGITLGEIFYQSLGNKKGIERYGFYSLPMDESLSTIALDLGGRSQLFWKVKFLREKIGKISTEMFSHFFKSFSLSARCNLHIHAIGKNDHHKIESIFKCFGKAIKMAIQKNSSTKIPSTKGIV
ncbi:bifunctional histidinol-phosphatase/imidazoleglycerol-phosphate dehydratase HisB [Blattabacterium sp. (Blaberus giganteus)]|uniref:bifunctional histidinol-phosphatase/imidazoleglycerol-phosphate dehydratase HisB n=1 Tax=Blattabacterium sp. (Blaberus giganteus) TaxID=1186051 RepID=UPI00025F6ECA|nr:bifunctional histidinol-phosphatase/imidazoleglycerol-phosphate dehydratase HisB [Blattabacterium sp. (Blaberus giganteus)]AFJ90651.1 bifunctional imidazole glycerol-phosphate dehydratase/histidinol phosphatase [Blattabacterium sp. (Blaberus giganteus)]